MVNEVLPTGCRYSSDVFRLRGEELHQQILPRLQPEDIGKFMAIDIESGEFEIDEDDYAVIDRLLKRIPQAQSWLCRVGYSAAYRMFESQKSGFWKKSDF